jgi:hypothetical protein
MQEPVKERVANLREISRIKDANREYVHGGKKAPGEVGPPMKALKDCRKSWTN